MAPGVLVCDPAAVAPGAAGATAPINANSLYFRPAPFASLYSAAVSQRELADFFWIGYYNTLHVSVSNRDRLALGEGASAGFVLFM